jgi:hypothetical protein
MADVDLMKLRPLLDQEEAYARAIAADDPRAAVAKRMLGLIADARAALRPSPDSTANYVPNKRIVEDLLSLRREADAIAGKNNR